MNKYLIFLLLFVCATLQIVAQSLHPFKLRERTETRFMPINHVFSSSDTLNMDFVDVPIEGLSIKGLLLQPCDSCFLRVILEDTLGSEFVVLESNRLFNDVDTLILDDYCMETKVLMDIVPQKLIFHIRNAVLEVDSIKYIVHNGVSGNQSHHIPALQNETEVVRREQVLELANHINEYNLRHNYIWVADTTRLALLPWREKKIMMGIEEDDDLGGLEYYAGGIFDFPHKAYWGVKADSVWNNQILNSSYVDHFDWRNRHGRNWITPAKQQQGGSCWAYSAIGALEAVVNLFYNRLIDMDLSEQELISCSRNDTYSYLVGGDEYTALKWIENNGVMDEESFPNQHANIPCEEAPEESFERISIQSASRVPPMPNSYVLNSYMPDSIKKYLIQKGPLTFAYKVGKNMGHAVVLVGYDVIREGQMIDFLSGSYSMNSVIVPPDYPYIGETFWILKNSYADYAPDYIFLHAPRSIILRPSLINVPITSRNYDENDIVCEDSDGDGFYFWGIGTKPPHCPDWVPNEPDGDDSDDTKGPIDEYGYLYDLMEHVNDTVFINNDTIWNQKKYMYNHVVVQNGAKLTIANDVTFYKNTAMIIRDAGSLLLDGGRLQSAVVKIDEMSGSSLEIRNNGVIEYREDKNFSLPLGNKMIMHYGKIH